MGTGGIPNTTPCMGASDPRLVVAPQRILRLTMNEIVNTVRYLIDSTEATTIASSGLFGQLNDESQRYFPPLTGGDEANVTPTNWLTLNNLAWHVAEYVLTNFTALTGCATATDICATTYLNGLAAKAYRRQLTTAEQTRFTGLYNKIKSQNVNGYAVTSTVQEATQYVVYGLFSSPQMIWRSEVGNPAMLSTSPMGVPLTDDELATHLAFFLTDQPPDDMLLGAARMGTLRANLTSHVNRILATQPAKDWLSTIMATFYLLNQLRAVAPVVDRMTFPIFSEQLLADMRTESQKFLDHALWSGGNLTDLLLSRTAFLNLGLANEIYKVPPPAGATGTNFVQTTLSATERSGILTNAGFITRAARSQEGGVVPRGLAVKATMLCLTTPQPPDAIAAPGGPLDLAKAMFATQTVQQQVAARAMDPLCSGCHKSFDAYGLVLDYYDNIGRYRTIDDKGMPVNARTMLPAELGGTPVESAVDLSQKLAASPAFTNCMATAILQYAMADYTAPVQLPLPPTQPGCAAADVAQRFTTGAGKTFSDLIRASTATPAFALRVQTP